MNQIRIEDTRWDVPNPSEVGKVVMDDGTEIVLRRHGNPDGTRLVLSHANGFGTDAYFPFWSLLTDRFDVVLFDLRNHGWNQVGSQTKHSIPTFMRDLTRISLGIARHFGSKKTIGVFHSLSAQIAAIKACSSSSSFDALVLFDPFICPAGCHPEHRDRLKGTMRAMVEAARRRRASFESLESFSDRLKNSPAFAQLLPGVAELLARVTLRPATDGQGYVLRCPPKYEAFVAEQGYRYASSVDIETLSCPVKVIGSDPVSKHSYLPTVAMDEILALNYDFIPETTHFLQLEEPEMCVSAMMEFIEENS